jgi:hypothetical protein
VKLWYQSLSHHAETNPNGRVLKGILKAVADPDSEIALRGVDTAGIGQHYRLLEYHDIGEVIANAIRAQREGYARFCSATSATRVYGRRASRSRSRCSGLAKRACTSHA